MTAPAHSEGTERIVRVWDVPTRLFHWALVILILVCWFTGEEEGFVGAVHRYAGEATAGLLVFRVIWGFVGGERARFSDFAAGPGAIASHIKSLFSRTPARHLGHNPLGGLAVFLLLLNVAVIVAAGLFSSGEGRSGPFAGLWGLELSEIHEVSFRVLQGLVVVHVLGVVIETLRTRDTLVPAMITGAKRRRADESGVDAKPAGFSAILAATIAGIAAAAILMNLPQDAPAPPGREHGE